MAARAVPWVVVLLHNRPRSTLSSNWERLPRPSQVCTAVFGFVVFACGLVGCRLAGWVVEPLTSEQVAKCARSVDVRCFALLPSVFVGLLTFSERCVGISGAGDLLCVLVGDGSAVHAYAASGGDPLWVHRTPNRLMGPCVVVVVVVVAAVV